MRTWWWLVGVGLVAGCAASRGSGGGTAPGDAGANAHTGGSGIRLVGVGSRYGALEDYSLYFQARTAMGAGDPARATERGLRLLEGHPDSIWTGSTRLLLGRLLRRTRDFPAARSWLESARTTLPEASFQRARASLAVAEVAHRLGDDGAALELIREVRRRFPRRALARRARRLSDRIARKHPTLVPWNAAEEGEMRLREGDAPGARASVAGPLADPGTPDDVRGLALWVQAQAERASGERDTAQATALHFARSFPTHALAPKALLTVAGWRWNADDDETALQLFRETLRRFPESAQAADALYGIGRIHQEARRYGEAFAAYRDLAERFPHHTLAPDGRWRAGWVRYLAGDFAAAAQWFDQKGRGQGNARAASEYWRARSLQRLGRRSEALTAFEHIVSHHDESYYADLAEERLGRERDTSGSTLKAPEAVFPAELVGPHADRARALATLGYERFARLELDALRDADEGRRRQLLEAYTAVGAPDAAILLAREMRPSSSSPGPYGRYIYPLAYWSVVMPTAARHEVDPLLVYSLIRQESLFAANAVSSASARGLMQLMPATARELAHSTGVPVPTVGALRFPQTNVGFGVTLLRRLLDRYEGSRVKALAAYNAGQEAVAKWERRYGAREPDEFVELISYRETRDYVKAVLRNYRAYRQLYVESPATTSPGSPPNAPFDMTAITSPDLADETR